ncbi:MAG: hypothetical protein J5749_02905, partial [Lachnospiraceae bacterium]|nr:hypothetical protein [Lachnospiraceae bacterium]
GKCYNFDSIENDSDYYHAQHIAGKIRSWEGFFNKFEDGYYTKEKNTVARIKELFLERDKYHTIIRDMYEVWDWNMLINKCDQIYEKYNHDLSAVFVD